MTVTETTLLTVTVPMTNDDCLGQNSRCDFRKRAAQTKALRAAARLMTVQQLGYRPLENPPDRIGVRWSFAWGQGRKLHDDDGCIGKTKAIRDGICDGLGVNDKCMVTLGVTQRLTVARQSEVVAELVALGGAE